MNETSEQNNYNYSKLLGLMREKGFTQRMISDEIDIGIVTLNKSLNNKRRFKQSEISHISDLLGIPECEIGTYFFATKL